MFVEDEFKRQILFQNVKELEQRLKLIKEYSYNSIQVKVKKRTAKDFLPKDVSSFSKIDFKI